MSSGSIRITLVRHGESVANRSQRWQGQGDSELSELGVRQAQAFAKRMRGKHFDLVVASDLQRASMTAHALGLPFERDASLREFDIGAWEGLTREQVAERFGDELARLDAGEDVAFGGGESYGSFCARVDAALGRLRDRLEPGQHALAVCHGGVIGALVSALLGLRGVRDLPMGRPFNTSVTELSFAADGTTTLHVFNDCLHLLDGSLFPLPSELGHTLALVCGGAPHAACGSFAAHYDLALHGEELCGQPRAALHFPELFERLRLRHPQARVSLSAAAESIHGWAVETLWPGVAHDGRLAAPGAGSLCHVSAYGERLVLLDYGAAIEAPLAEERF